MAGGPVEIAVDERVTTLTAMQTKWGAKWDAFISWVGVNDRVIQAYLTERRNPDEDFWIVREMYRCAQKQDRYQSITEFFTTPQNATLEQRLLFPHVAIQDPLKIAYTPSANYGKTDRQVVTTVGRFFTKYYSEHLSAAQIRDLTTLWRDRFSADDVKWARTSDEIEQVYLTSAVASCMTKPADCDDYANCDGVHPTRAYGGPDTAIAYLERDKRIVSRTVVFEPKKLYVRIFGDDLLRVKLESNGYRQGSLNGARLLRIPINDGFICPYIDGSAQAVIDDGKHLIVKENDGVGTSQYGFVRFNSDDAECYECEDMCDTSEMTRSRYHGAMICHDCRESHYHQAMNVHGGVIRTDLIREDNCVYIENAGYIAHHDVGRVLELRDMRLLSDEYYNGRTALIRTRTITTDDGHLIAADDARRDPAGNVFHYSAVVEVDGMFVHVYDDLSGYYIDTEGGTLIHESDVEGSDDDGSVECIRVHQWLFWMLCFMSREDVDNALTARFGHGALCRCFQRAVLFQISTNPVLNDGPVQHNIFLEAA